MRWSLRLIPDRISSCFGSLLCERREMQEFRSSKLARAAAVLVSLASGMLMLPGFVPAAQQGSGAGAETAKAKEPTTATAAIKLLDLRKIQKLNSNQVFEDLATSTTYTSKASLAAAIAYYTAELGSLGWVEART